MLIDTHAHINLNAFRDDAAAVMQRSFEVGVTVVNVGTEINSSRQAVSMLEQFPRSYAAVGLHPGHTYDSSFHDANEAERKILAEKFDYETYKQLAQHPRVVGIGECGLDYYRLPSDVDQVKLKDTQRHEFVAQANLAIELDKALCIHCRPAEGTNDAYEEIFGLLKNLKADHSNLRFEIHCYTGNLDTAQQFVALSGFLGLNGIITFDKSGRSEEVVKNIPLESIVLETDAPYLAPAPHRGQRNEPAYVELVARRIADWTGRSYEEVAEITTNNAKRLFNLPLE